MEFTKETLINKFVRHKLSGDVAKIAGITRDEYGVYEFHLFGHFWPTVSYINFKAFLNDFVICNEIEIAIQDNILRQVVYDALKGANIYNAFTAGIADANNIHLKFQAILGDIVSGIKERELNI